MAKVNPLNHYRLKAERFELRLKVVLKAKPETLNNIIPAKAGIQIQRHPPGFRIKSGMTKKSALDPALSGTERQRF